MNGDQSQLRQSNPQSETLNTQETSSHSPLAAHRIKGEPILQTAWNEILWDQFGASIDMLAQAIHACPDDLWSAPSNPPQWNPNGVVGF